MARIAWVLSVVACVFLAGCRSTPLSAFMPAGCPSPCAAPCAPVAAPICGPVGPKPFDPLLACGCGHECGEMYIGAGLSILPNVGGALDVGYVFGRSSLGLWSAEVQGTWQPIDDKTFIDDGNPEAEDWWSIRTGVKLTTSPDRRRHWTARAGGVWFRANGEPNWVDTAGTWWGVYGAFGFETDLTREWTVGPSITVMAAVHEDGDDFELVPVFNWTATLWLGGRDTCDLRCLDQDWCRPLGELYLDGFVTGSAGIGPGLAFGQVFQRHPGHTGSFEVAVAYENVSDDLFGNEEGELAQVFGGVKFSFIPHRRLHPVVRGGVTWFRTTADIEWVNEPGDYLGGYISAGLELDINQRLTTGPELGVSFVTQEGGNVEVEFLPRLSWHLILKL